MASQWRRLEVPGNVSARDNLMRLAREASVELNVKDLQHLDSTRHLLPARTKIYISHLPKQSFDETLAACAAVRAAGFDPIPHLPVRLLESHDELNEFVGEAGKRSVNEILLISGDYPHPRGPYSTVAQVLQSTDLKSHGISSISIGGHPEGHAKVSLAEIRAAELDKARIALDAGLQATFVTQFFFEASPFLEWARRLRAAGVTAHLRAGLAGPAGVATLLRYAVRCGVGPSIKALGSRPSAFAKLLGEHGPENILIDLADVLTEHQTIFDGIHLFCFGGFPRTCQWLHSLASGKFTVDAANKLTVQ